MDQIAVDNSEHSKVKSGWKGGLVMGRHLKSAPKHSLSIV